MTIEKLGDAITELDSDILDRYFIMKQSFSEKKKPNMRTWVKWASLAACLCLIITASIAILPYIVKPNLEGPATYYYVGDRKIRRRCERDQTQSSLRCPCKAVRICSFSLL